MHRLHSEGNFTLPFKALTIPWASCHEIPAVDIDVTEHLQETHSPQAQTPCLTRARDDEPNL